MPKLSVNLNKVALIRNSRDTRIPDIVLAAKTAIDAGAAGITVHPRPDQRHIRPDDVRRLAALLAEDQYKDIEFNIEGNPFAMAETNGYPGFLALVAEIKPHQATLVPDSPTQLTSDHGWDLCGGENEKLAGMISDLKQQNIRVSLFMDSNLAQIRQAAQIGADRIEFYTGPYADAYPDHQQTLSSFITAATLASELSLGINAGHDLNLENLDVFCTAIPDLDEVSIGHAIITDALWMGLTTTVEKYVAILSSKRNT
ncbi:MAG: pyridoxine 5'-phosphate synthase [Pseudomonadales bacterium]|nr:pyridoxine 5'-phosphate synthase [Pseudomonadales bacterium]